MVIALCAIRVADLPCPYSDFATVLFNQVASLHQENGGSIMRQMTWAYIIRSSDRRMFKRCRRAWDLDSRLRQNYEPLKPRRVFDFEGAIQKALAVYYFPGMWEWNREIVLPLAIEGFLESMQQQREQYVERHRLSSADEGDWHDDLELGEMMLKRYFAWAVANDRFSPIRVETEFEVNIPDPIQPGNDLLVRAGVPIRYHGRINLLVVDGRDAYWLIKHQVVDEKWNKLDHLLLDEEGVSYCWAWESFFLGMKIAGIIYNEMRKYPHGRAGASQEAMPSTRLPESLGDDRPGAQQRRTYRQADREPDQIIKQQENQFFRRTQIPRSRKELKNASRQLALEVLDLANPEVRIYPNPSLENCRYCDYLRPCIAMNEGLNASAILETSYRKRGDEESDAGRIGGSTWSVDRGAMPPNFGQKS
jgi:PD-(D/E)XK nuclease superfamily